MITREEVRWGYLFILGREPESEEAYATHIAQPDLATFRQALIESSEGLSRLRPEIRAADSKYRLEYFRSVLVFIHVEKTGGTALQRAIAACRQIQSPAAGHFGFLSNASIGELNQYDFVGGHFSYDEAMAIPRAQKMLITMFREPFARLISLYRFFRTHPRHDSQSQLIKLAQELGPVEYFQHEFVLNHPKIDNVYARTFSQLPDRKEEWSHGVERAALALVLERIERMDAVGITEEMGLSTQQIADRVGIAMPAELPRCHVTDEFANTVPGFLPVEKVVLSDELRSVMRPLVSLDLAIYEHATSLLHQRSSVTAACAASP